MSSQASSEQSQATSKQYLSSQPPREKVSSSQAPGGPKMGMSQQLFRGYAKLAADRPGAFTGTPRMPARGFLVRAGPSQAHLVPRTPAPPKVISTYFL